MLKTTLSLLVLLAASMPAFAAEPTLLFGCQVLPRGGGVEVVFAESSAPIPLPDGSLVPSSALVGRRCSAVIEMFSAQELIDGDQLTASANLVIHSERRQLRDGIDADVPDCIIWDIDTANVAGQLICDIAAGEGIVAQESAASVKNYVGWKCADALADLGGLAAVARSSVVRPPQAPIRVRSNRLPSQSGSVLFYQLTLNLQ